MAFTVEQIRNEALRLPPEERARLAGDLIDSLDELAEVDLAAVDAAWRAEVRRRVGASPSLTVVAQFTALNRSTMSAPIVVSLGFAPSFRLRTLRVPSGRSSMRSGSLIWPARL